MKFENALRVGDIVLFDGQPRQITHTQIVPIIGSRHYTVFVLDNTKSMEFALGLDGPALISREFNSTRPKTFKLIGSAAQYIALLRQLNRQKGIPEEITERIALAIGIPRATTRSINLGHRRR
jgi:hypothetical protein